MRADETRRWNKTIRIKQQKDPIGRLKSDGKDWMKRKKEAIEYLCF